MHSLKRKRRLGASLLEALIATVILLISVAALSSQAAVGVRAANRARLQSMASTICRSVLAEHLAANKLTSSSAARVAGFDGWMAQTRVEALSHASTMLDDNAAERLCLVSVTVWQPGVAERLSKTTLSQVVRSTPDLPFRVASSLDVP